jgi:hypothetical protein
LLVGTAWLAGDPVPAGKPATVTAPAHAPAVIYNGGGCGSGCGSGCGAPSCCDDCGRTRWRDRIRGLFRRSNDDCCNPCATVSCAPAPSCCTPTTHVRHSAPSSCCQSSCDSCCERQSFGAKLRERLRGLFRRNNDCCDSGCGNGCGSGCGPGCGATYGGTVITHPPGHVGKSEPIPPPKDNPPAKMPDGKPGDPPAKGGARINITPAQPFPAAAPALQQVPAAPAASSPIPPRIVDPRQARPF